MLKFAHQPALAYHQFVLNPKRGGGALLLLKPAALLNLVLSWQTALRIGQAGLRL